MSYSRQKNRYSRLVQEFRLLPMGCLYALVDPKNKKVLLGVTRNMRSAFLRATELHPFSTKLEILETYDHENNKLLLPYHAARFRRQGYSIIQKIRLNPYSNFNKRYNPKYRKIELRYGDQRERDFITLGLFDNMVEANEYIETMFNTTENLWNMPVYANNAATAAYYLSEQKTNNLDIDEILE